MLKTIRLSNKLASKIFSASNNKVIKSSGKVDKTIVNSSKTNKLKNNKSKNLILVLNISAIDKPTFLTLNTKKDFNYLWQALIKVLILQNFDLEFHI